MVVIFSHFKLEESGSRLCLDGDNEHAEQLRRISQTENAFSAAL